MAYGDFKDLARTTASHKAFNTAKYRMMDIKENWLLWFTNFSIKSQKEVVLILGWRVVNN